MVMPSSILAIFTSFATLLGGLFGGLSGESSQASEAPKAEPVCVETHQFSGASTAASSFEAWFAGEDFALSPQQTMDLSEFSLPNGDVVRPGDSVCKTEDGSFTLVK